MLVTWCNAMQHSVIKSKSKLVKICKKMKIKRVCEFCGKEFTAQTVTKRFCSTQCTNRSYKLRKRQEFVATYILKEQQEKKDLMKSLTKEVMTVRLAAEYLSIHPVTIYRYIRSGIIRAMHLPGKTLIKRADIDHLFETLGDIPERTHEFKEAKKPELTTVKETAQRYSISFPGAYKLLKEHKIPCTTIRGKTYYSLAHVTRLFNKRERESHPEITEWYTSEEICRKYDMTLSAVYNFINENGIPSKRVKRLAYYSKHHVDVIKEKSDGPVSSDYYTVQECMSKYNFSRDQVYHHLKYHNVKRIHKGKYCMFLKRDFDRIFEIPEPR